MRMIPTILGYSRKAKYGDSKKFSGCQIFGRKRKG